MESPRDIADATIAEPLIAALRRQLKAPALEYAEPPTPIGQGGQARIMAFSLADPEAQTHWGTVPLVCRIELDPAIDPGEMRRSAALHHILSDQGFPAPRIVAIGDQADGIGAPFTVMERLSGESVEVLVEQFTFLWAGTLVVAAIFNLSLQLWLVLFGGGAMGVFLLAWFTARLLRRLHAIPLTTLINHPDLNPAAMALHSGNKAKLDELYHAIAESSATELEPGLVWLYEHVPVDDGRNVLCHGDFHGGNVIIDFKGKTGILDWPRSVIAAREFDLAWTLLVDAFVPDLNPDAPALNRWIEAAYWSTRMCLIWAYLRIQEMWYRLAVPLDAEKYQFFIAYHALFMLALGGPMASGSIPQRRLRRYFKRATGINIADAR